MSAALPHGADLTVDDLGGRRVLFVMAAAAEYGAALQARITPLITGVGPIEGALGAAIALKTLHSAGELPDLVVSLGSAGSRVLEQGRIFQVASVSWRDIDASALGFARGTTPFLDEPAEIMLPTPVPSLPRARLSTGGNVVTGAAYNAIDADMVDMETFAVARACRIFGVPLVGFRGISDGASDLHHYDDWTRLLGHIDAGLADAVDRLAVVLEAVLVPGRDGA